MGYPTSYVPFHGVNTIDSAGTSVKRHTVQKTSLTLHQLLGSKSQSFSSAFRTRRRTEGGLKGD